MKLIGKATPQTAFVLTSKGQVKSIDYKKSNYYGLQIVGTVGTEVEDYDERFDVHYTMSDDGSQYYNVFHALNEGEDGVVDMVAYSAASEAIRKQVLDEIYVKCNPNYNRDDVSFMMEVLSKPTWTYTRFVEHGDWTKALEDALGEFDNSAMMAAMLGAISTTMTGLGVTSITFEEDDV